MARFNEILVGRYNRFLQKFLSMKGGPPAPQLASEVAATWALFHGAENRYLEGWDKFWTVISATSAAGNRAATIIVNPAGSNVIATIERILIFTSAADNPQITYSFPTNRVAQSAPVNMDNRGRPSASVQPQNSVNAGAIAGSVVWQGISSSTLAADVVFTDIQEIPFPPNLGLTVWSNILASTITVSYMWRERFLEDSERT